MQFTTSRLAQGAKVLLLIFAAALPLLFLPQPLGVGLGREAVLSVLIVGAAMLWLLSALASGEVRWSHSPVLYAGAALVLVFAASAFLSVEPRAAFLSGDTAVERVWWLALGLVLMIAAGAVPRRREDADALVGTLILAGGVSALATALQLLFGISLLRYLGVAAGPDANVIGTINGLALFYAAVFMMSAGALVAPGAREWSRMKQGAMAASAGLLFFSMLLINFRTAWIATLGSAVLLFGLLLVLGGSRRSSGSLRLRWRHWAVMAVIAVSAVMMTVRGPLFPNIALSAEVSPSLGATVSVARSVFKESPIRVLLGSGPGTFARDWALYKDASINRTIFWGVRFAQGQSWVVTLLPTVGVLGLAAFVLFFGWTLFVFLRALLGSMSGDSWLLGAFAGFISLLAGAFLYPANSWLVLALFFLTGLLLLMLRAPAPMPEEAGSEDTIPADEDGYGDGTEDGEMSGEDGDAKRSYIKERVIRWAAPGSVFASSLIILFLVSWGALAIYAQVNRVRAAYAAGRGLAAAGRGDSDGALSEFGAASSLEPQNENYLQALVGARADLVRRVIQRATQGEKVQEEFQGAVSLAIQDARRLTDLFGQDASAWRAEGAVYELIIPFIQGSERFAVAAYQKASQREPASPAIYAEWGRAGLAFTDRIQIAINQSKDQKEREELDQARKSNLEEIVKLFQKAIDLKPDFAPAHFLLAAVAIRQGNIEGAIQNVESAKIAAPFDIGVAFQLGLLYYQKNDLDKAEAEFLRAVSQNENYSNARYFLGLIYDRGGDRARATEQFERIASLNPDNQEVKRVLANLDAGKPALDGIVPPAPPPERRSEAPIKEREQGSSDPSR